MAIDPEEEEEMKKRKLLPREEVEELNEVSGQGKPRGAGWDKLDDSRVSPDGHKSSSHAMCDYDNCLPTLSENKNGDAFASSEILDFIPKCQVSEPCHLGAVSDKLDSILPDGRKSPPHVIYADENWLPSLSENTNEDVFASSVILNFIPNCKVAESRLFGAVSNSLNNSRVPPDGLCDISMVEACEVSKVTEEGNLQHVTDHGSSDFAVSNQEPETGSEPETDSNQESETDSGLKQWGSRGHRRSTPTAEISWKKEKFKAEYCADLESTIAIYVHNHNAQKKKPKISAHRQIALKLKNHLSFLGWEIEFRDSDGRGRFRYTSPKGETYYSLPKVCDVLVHQETNHKQEPEISSEPETDCNQETEMDHGSSDLAFSNQEPATGIEPGTDSNQESETDSELEQWGSKGHRRSGPTAEISWKEKKFKAECCADLESTIAIYVHNHNAQKKKLKRSDHHQIALKLKKHLSFLGWKIEFKDSDGRGRFRYTSPKGETYYSLPKVCDVLGHQETNHKQEPEISSEPETDCNQETEMDHGSSDLAFSNQEPETGSEPETDSNQETETDSELEQRGSKGHRRSGPTAEISWKKEKFKAEYCADLESTIAIYVHNHNAQKKKPKRSAHRQIALKLKKHLSFLGWKIEFKDSDGRGRFRYISPKGETYYSLSKVCDVLGHQETNHKQGADTNCNTMRDKDHTELLGRRNANSLVIKNNTKKQVTTSKLVSVKEGLGSVVRNFVEHERSGDVDTKLRENAEKQLECRGWLFRKKTYYKSDSIKMTMKCFTSPTGKDYNSLLTACEAYLKEEEEEENLTTLANADDYDEDPGVSSDGRGEVLGSYSEED